MKEYIALMPQAGMTTGGKLTLPDGCTGLLLVFRTKTAARKYFGKNVPLITVRSKEDNNAS